MLAGVLALSYCCFVVLQASAAKRSAAAFGRVHASQRVRASQIAAEEEIVPSEAGKNPAKGESSRLFAPVAVIGRIDIPQLGLSAPVTSGIGVEDLRQGVGHVPGTAFAGGLGTMGLAGHRDTFFRRLRGVAAGMEIRVADTTGVYRYEADSTEVVAPERVEVLDTQTRPSLTLITCHPFNYIGSAPNRFIVHAHLISAAPID